MHGVQRAQSVCPEPFFELDYAYISSLHSFKSAFDLRNTYIVSGLGLVEILRPSFVIGEFFLCLNVWHLIDQPGLVENVVAMAAFPLQARDGENGTLKDGINWGTHKFILRTLMDLG